MSFADLGLSDELLRAVTESGYSDPTPVQTQAIPSILMMRDLIAIAQTGTGKTAAFVLPMIDVLGEGRTRARMPRSLILEPTRELAAQVAENFEKYGKYHKLSMALLIGGVQMGDQVKALEKGVDVLIATPGRLMDLFERGKILLTGCNLLVIDEADRMLDMGFIPDIENICTKLPSNRQTLLFSATMPPPIKKLADKFLSNPKTIEVARPASTNINIAQFLVETEARKKREVLRDLLRSEDVNTAIIFCNRKTTVRELATSLKQHRFLAGEIHGDMDQPARLRELERFKAGEINVLVASDVAARGLDVKGVSHVFNFDAPWHPDDYVHRIGRTGRAGALGRAFTFITKEDAEAIENIEKLTGQTIERIKPAGGMSEDGPARTARNEDVSAEKPSRRRKEAPRREKAVPEQAQDDHPELESVTPHSREEGPARKERSARDARPVRAERPTQPEQAREEAPPRALKEGDAEWNGPVPGFLSFGAR